ncbi:MAG TPA: DUF4097 family beta strand repeat-containing protein [Gemmatimonadaceae bacterium]
MRYGRLGALVASVVVVGCSHAGADDNAFHWMAELPAGTVVHFRDGAGNITVRRAAAGGQRLAVTGSRQWRRGRAKDVQFMVSHVGNDYYVCAMWSGSGKCGPSGYKGRSTGGFLTMFSLFHRTSDATADLVAELPPNLKVDARTTFGSVDISGATAGVIARTTNGNVSAANVSGPVALTTTSGNVELTVDSVSDADSIRVSTINGNIRVELPAALQGRFDLSATNGMVHSNLPLPSAQSGRSTRRVQGQVGTLDRLVRLHTTNGVVSVTTRGAPATQ